MNVNLPNTIAALSGVLILLIGLLVLETYPIVGVLAALAGMAQILSALADCGGADNAYEHNLQRANKENTHGA